MREACLRLLRRPNAQQTWTLSPISTRISGRGSVAATFGRQALIKPSACLQASRHISSLSQPYSESEDTVDLERDIFVRARPYGIIEENQLQLESRIGGSPGTDKRLIDQKRFRNDYHLWCIFLDFQRLRYGDDGVRTVWRDMKLRCGYLGVPFQGEQADHLWSVFVSTGTRDPDFMKSICQYEIKKGCQRPTFFVEVVGGLLRSENGASAHVFASMLKRSRTISNDEVFRVFQEACESRETSALRHFCKVHDVLPGSKIYGSVITYLCTLERPSDAWLMHRHLLSRQDLPQTFEAIRPLVEDISANNLNLELFLQSLEASNVSFSAQAFRLYTHERARYMGLSTENLNIVSSKTFGIRRQGLSDEFVARAFATRSLSFGLVLNGLRFIGLTTLGPLSIRQIALAAGGVHSLAERFATLKELEIDLGSSAYVRIVRNLTAQRSTVLLDAVLNSDQHPDVFEDLDLQKRLLASYYRQQDWASVDRTIAVLTRAEIDARAQEHARNYLLQAALAVRDWSGVQFHLAKLRADGSSISFESSNAMYMSSMPHRHKGKRVSRQEIHDTQNLIRLWQEVLKSGKAIPMSLWREPIRRLGMAGTFADLQRIVLWLASWYGKQSETRSADVKTRQPIPGLQQFFEPWLQSAIITWAFIRPAKMKGDTSEIDANKPEWHLQPSRYPWIRGINLLRILHTEYDVEIDMPNMHRTCISRMRPLYAPTAVSRVRRNYYLRIRNTVSLEDCMRTINEAWGSSIFSYPERDKARILSTGLARRLQRQRPRPRRKSSPQTSTTVATAYPEDEKKDPMAGVVVYRDIFHATEDDYKTTGGRQSVP